MAKWRQTVWDKDEDKQKIALKVVINKVHNFCSGVVLVFFSHHWDKIPDKKQGRRGCFGLWIKMGCNH